MFNAKTVLNGVKDFAKGVTALAILPVACIIHDIRTRKERKTKEEINRQLDEMMRRKTEKAREKYNAMENGIA